VIPFRRRPSTWEEWLDRLRAEAPPPATPFGGAVDWRRFRSENGFDPPADYQALLDLYGTGALNARLGTLRFEQASHPKRSLLAATRWARDNLRGLQRAHPGTTPPWPIFPEPGGFLPFAANDTSWTVGWLTNGVPNGWTTAIDGGRDGWWAAMPYGAVELAARWVEGGLGIEEVPRVESGGRFIAATEDAYWSDLTETAQVVFGASAASATFSHWGIDRVRAMVAPGKLIAFGSGTGPATEAGYGPRRGTISVAYRPEDAQPVAAALRRLAVELGTRIDEARALDGSPIWMDGR
jgi:hypothetical protein